MITYTSPIDPHVHLRGEEYTTNFLKFGFQDAQAVGIAAFLEMPNTNPWLISDSFIQARKYQVHAQIRDGNFPTKHGIHMGLTNDIDQVESALQIVLDNRYGIVSDKTFYVHSTGNMGITEHEKQKAIWELKSNMNYQEVSIGHFEDENVFSNIPFNPSKPDTHSIRQNPQAELVQVQRQVKFAKDAHFTGTFYVAHCSNPETIDFLHAEKNLPFQFAIETTFHHMFLNEEDYNFHGTYVKMNPPLRDSNMQEALLERVLDGKTHTIGTDHAPHPSVHKIGKQASSGIPTLPFWPKGIELLQKLGISQSHLDNITFNNANTLFQLNRHPHRIITEYKPALWEKYGFNPFSRFNN